MQEFSQPDTDSFAFLLLPVVLLMMLPGALFGGSDADDPMNPETEDAVWDESAVEEILFDDYGAVSETFTDACDAVDSVMQSAYEQVLLEIQTGFASYGEGYTMNLTDPYTDELPHDNIHSICEYSVLTDTVTGMNPKVRTAAKFMPITGMKQITNPYVNGVNPRRHLIVFMKTCRSGISIIPQAVRKTYCPHSGTTGIVRSLMRTTQNSSKTGYGIICTSTIRMSIS